MYNNLIYACRQSEPRELFQIGGKVAIMPSGLKEEIRIERGVPEDAGEILTLQRAAYQSEAIIYGDPAISPLVQTLEELREEIDNSIVIKAQLGARLAGSVRASCDGGTLHIGRLIVAPDLHGHGIGTLLMDAIEQTDDRAQRFELFTGDRSEDNLRFYQRLGYHEFRRKEVSPALVLVFLEKQRPT